MQDFQLKNSELEFHDLMRKAAQIVRLPEQARRSAAYEAANDYVLTQCDVLMALWDGGSALGKGGTGAMVAQARHLRRPLYWIWAHNCKPNAPQVRHGKTQGSVQLENF